MPKELKWVGRSLEDLRAFPEDARREAGHQLNLVQLGLEPDDYRPMPSVGPGVVEIRVRAVQNSGSSIWLSMWRASSFFTRFDKKTRKNYAARYRLGQGND